MSTPDPDPQRQAIQAAIERLLAGRPTLVPIGNLSIVALAKEAGVGRHLLTQKHTDLKDEFEERRQQIGIKTEDPQVTQLREEELALRLRNARLADENAELRTTASGALRTAQCLHKENQLLTDQVQRLHRALERLDTQQLQGIVALPQGSPTALPGLGQSPRLLRRVHRHWHGQLTNPNRARPRTLGAFTAISPRRASSGPPKPEHGSTQQ